jgi:hypothetical protein
MTYLTEFIVHQIKGQQSIKLFENYSDPNFATRQID